MVKKLKTPGFGNKFDFLMVDTLQTEGFDSQRFEEIPEERDGENYNFKPRSYNIKPKKMTVVNEKALNFNQKSVY